MSRILCLGASYGLLLGVKLALTGHEVTFVGRRDEVEALKKTELKVRIPLRRSDETAELKTAACFFTVPEDADPQSADLVLLAMQEPQLAHSAIAALMDRIGLSGTPCLSLMNIPPASFLRRLGLPEEAFTSVYNAPHVWDSFAPGKVSNASPDPQAVRMDPSKPGELTVTLASNFKAAPFEDAQDQALLSRLAKDVSRLKVEHAGRMIATPVHLLAHSSVFVPLAKWPMLLTGNYRCVTTDGSRSIADAVLSDPAASKRIYARVMHLLKALGVPEDVLVPFEAYAKAAQNLKRPSSIARALQAKASAVERVDTLIFNLLKIEGMDADEIGENCALTDRLLEANAKSHL